MADVILSLHNNTLRASVLDPKHGLQNYELVLDSSAASGSDIVDPALFSQELANFVQNVIQKKKSGLEFVFLVEPSDVLHKFVSVSKNGSDQDSQILAGIRAQLGSEELDALYHFYFKIAPFVYQFTAIKKVLLDTIVTSFTSAGLSLKAVVPWLVFLPKFANVNDPAVFIANRDGKEIVALSEFGSVFYSGEFEYEKTVSALYDVIKNSTLYKRTKPIDKIYTLNYYNQALDQNFKLLELNMPDAAGNIDAAFSVNILSSFFMDSDQDEFFKFNLLNLLPLPVVEKKNSALVYAGTLTAIFVLGFGLFGLYSKFIKTTGALPLGDSGNVLGEETPAVVPPVVQPPVTQPQDPNPSVVQTPTFDKKTVSVRVENAAGVSGLAARTRDLLTSDGWKVVAIDTADTNSEPTVVKLKKSQIAAKEAMLATLKAKFPNIVVEDTLPAEVSYDILVLTGSSAKL